MIDPPVAGAPIATPMPVYYPQPGAAVVAASPGPTTTGVVGNGAASGVVSPTTATHDPYAVAATPSTKHDPYAAVTV